jgi:hypothetical protein
MPNETTTPAAQGDTAAAVVAGAAPAKPAEQAPQSTQQSAPKVEQKPGSFLDAAQKEAAAPQKTDGQPKASTDGTAAPVLELKLPEGVKADSPLAKAFLSTASELGLKGEQAQKIVDSYAKVAAETNQHALQAWDQRIADDRKALEAHPEIGGQNLDKAQADARRAINWLDREEKGLGRELVKELSDAGKGNSVVVARLLSSLGKRLSEDQVGRGGVAAAANASESQQLQQLYPSMFNTDGTPKY